MIGEVLNPQTMLQMSSHVKPAMYTAKPPYMSPNLPKTRSVLAMTSENAVAGQTLDDCEMLSSRMSIGRITLKPETKYSVMIWDMTMLKTNANSSHAVLNSGGRSRP